MTVETNKRVGQAPINFLWEDMRYKGQVEHPTSIEAGLRHMFLVGAGKGHYRPELHQLNRVVWADGSWTWAHWDVRSWGDWLTVYVTSPTGSPLLTARMPTKEVL